jgi:hypothetical protein
MTRTTAQAKKLPRLTGATVQACLKRSRARSAARTKQRYAVLQMLKRMGLLEALQP